MENVLKKTKKKKITILREKEKRISRISKLRKVH